MASEIPHILVECQQLIPSARVGVLEVLRELERQGRCVVRFRRFVEIRRKDIVWSDVVVFVRACEPIELELAREVERQGRYIAYFLDDDLLHVPENTGSFAYFSRECIQSSLKEILSLSDLLWGVNELLIGLYGQYCPGEVLITKVPVRIVCAQDKAPEECVRLLYAGSTDHEPLVREFLAPAVEKLARELESRVQFLFIGVDPQLPDCQNVQVKKFINDYDAYRRLVDEGNFDIGLAIVRQTEFYRCKYYNKFVEYTAIGAVGVYTASEPYTLVIEDRGNGYLCENTVEGWYQALREAVLDTNGRKKVLSGARMLVREQFSYVKVADSLLAVKELFAGKAPEITVWQVKNRNGFWQFCFSRIIEIVRKKGLWAIPEILCKGCKMLVNIVCSIFQKHKI